jgi:hypothetical protein
MDWTTGVQFLAGAVMGFFLFSAMSISEPYPASYPMDIRGLLPQGVKWLGCEVDHIPTSSVEDKNMWSCTSTPHYVFIVWCLIKQEILLNGIVNGTVLS